MNVLLLRLAGPMQAWGTQSRFTARDTGQEPSKSGVIGLLCSALGMARAEPVDNLANLRMGVRVDREGSMKRDYQTAGGKNLKGENYGVITADGKSKRAVTSHRYYLADASFLVGIAGEDLSLLKKIHLALKNPRWPLFLGRKAFPPSEPLYIADGLKINSSLSEALKMHPGVERRKDKVTSKIRFVLEDENGENVRIDQPLVPFSERLYGPRNVKVHFIAAKQIPLEQEE